MILHILAAAYAQNGRFSEAVKTAQQSLRLAIAQNNTALADSLRMKIELYQKRFPTGMENSSLLYYPRWPKSARPGGRHSGEPSFAITPMHEVNAVNFISVADVYSCSLMMSGSLALLVVYGTKYLRFAFLVG